MISVRRGAESTPTHTGVPALFQFHPGANQETEKPNLGREEERRCARDSGRARRPEGRKGWGSNPTGSPSALVGGDEMVLSAIEAEEECKRAPNRSRGGTHYVITSIPPTGPSHRLPLPPAAVLE